MPGEIFKNVFSSDSSELVRLYKSAYNQAQNSQSIKHIIAFSKALAECAVPEGYILADAIKDVQSNVKSIEDLKYIWNRVLKKHPEYMVCLPLLLVGLGTFIGDHTKEIYDEVKKFYKGAISILPTIVKGITQALSGTTLTGVGLESLNQLVDGAMVMGLGYLLYWQNKGIDLVEEKAMNSISKVGQMIALYMTLFAEFRWAMISIFIKNVKGQIDSRVKAFLEIRKLLQKMQYEQFISSGQESLNQREAYIELYKAALGKLESTIPLVNNIERKLFKTSTFDKFLNNRVQVNLEDSKQLLLKQRNQFLEHYFHGDIADTDDVDSSWKFYLSNDYTGVSAVENAPSRPVFWTGTPNGADITLTKVLVGVNINDTNKIILSKVPVSVDLPSSEQGQVWVEQKTNFATKPGDIILINSQFVKVSKVEKLFIFNRNLIQGNKPEGTLLAWHCNGFTKVQLFSDGEGGFTQVRTENSIECGYVPGTGNSSSGETSSQGYTATFLLLEAESSSESQADLIAPLVNDTSVELFRTLDSSSAIITNEWKTFTFTRDGGYIISDLKSVENVIPPPYSLDINKSGIDFIKQMWDKSKNYSLYIFFKTGDVSKSFKMLGLYPNMVEKESERREAVSQELPEPFKSMYSTYSNLKDKPLNKFTGEDFLNIGGNLSTFLFGRDIIKDNIYKFKNSVLSYDKYLESSSNLLSQMCPLKNSYIYFYTLMNTLKNLDSEIDITNTIVLRDWLALNNRLILDTLTSMTQRDPATSEFLTIQMIKESPFMTALVPSALLDIDNIEMMKLIATLDNDVGTGLNKNRELQKMYFKLINFIKWLRDLQVIERLQETEDQIWTSIYNSLLSSVNMMLAGGELRSVKSVMKKNMRLLYLLTVRLNQLSNNLNYFLAEGNQYTSIMTDPSMKDFQAFLNRNGLGHFYEYVKNGQWKNFVNEKIDEWVGKYSPLINCLLKYKKAFNIGLDERVYLDKMINYLTKWQRGDILTQFELDVTGTFKSLNLNFLAKTPVGLKTSISNNLKLIENANKLRKTITQSLATVKI